MSDIPGYVRMKAGPLRDLAQAFHVGVAEVAARSRDARDVKLLAWSQALPWWSPWRWWHGVKPGNRASIINLMDAWSYGPFRDACEAAGCEDEHSRSHEDGTGFHWYSRTRSLADDADVYINADDAMVLTAKAAHAH